MKIFKISILCGLFTLAGCATGTKSASGPELATQVLPDQGPVRLELRPVVGAFDKTQYKSRSTVRTYEAGEILRKISEGVDFTVETKVTQVDEKSKTGTYLLTTTEKDGKLDLADFAMPEVGESLEVVLTSKGMVLKSGQNPPGTIYFIPPVALPDRDVRVGETWPMTVDWVSLKSGISLRMGLVSILKAIRLCGGERRCAEIELSGDVSIIGLAANPLATPNNQGEENASPLMRFRSDIRGHLLLSLETGAVLYSVLRSDESIDGMKDSVKVSSCMLTYVIEPVADRVYNGDGECPKLSTEL
jgi:hypothetical protein